MKFRRVTFKFKEPLTKIVYYQAQSVKQEEIFFTDVEGIKADIRKRLNKMLKSLGLLQFMNKDLVGAMQVRIAGLDATFESLVEFKKVDDLTYTFTYPLDLTAMVTLKKWGLNIGPFKMAERDIRVGQLIKDKRLVDGLKLFTFREMKLTPQDYEIQTEDLEATDEPAHQG